MFKNTAKSARSAPDSAIERGVSGPDRPSMPALTVRAMRATPVGLPLDFVPGTGISALRACAEKPRQITQKCGLPHG